MERCYIRHEILSYEKHYHLTLFFDRFSKKKKKEKNRDLKERKKDCDKIRTQLSSGKKKKK